MRAPRQVSYTPHMVAGRSGREGRTLDQAQVRASTRGRAEAAAESTSESATGAGREGAGEGEDYSGDDGDAKLRGGG